jgi:hypothetical protein
MGKEKPLIEEGQTIQWLKKTAMIYNTTQKT